MNMDIFSKIFSQKPAAQVAPNGIQSQPQVTPNAGQGVVPNGAEQAPAGSGQEAKSGLDEFNDFWQTDPNAAAKGNQQLFNVDVKKLQEAVGKTNFAGNIPKDLLAKIAAGGEDAVAALPQILNSVSANSFVQQTQTNTKIMEAAIAKVRAEIMGDIPNLIKQQSVSEGLKKENPIFSHPAAAPMLDIIQQQMQQKYPNATSAELQSKAKAFMVSFAEAANPASNQQQQAASQDTDWSKFLE